MQPADHPLQDLEQAGRFLHLLEKMDAASQTSFRAIYDLAPKAPHRNGPAVSGEHVRFAMIEALRHPSIAYWVRMNLALRVTRKLMMTAGLRERSEQYSRLLEDFHVAADAFILALPLPEAANRRRLQAQLNRKHREANEQSAFVAFGGGISEEEIDLLREFKRRIIPGFIQAIRQSHHRRTLRAQPLLVPVETRRRYR